MKVRIIFLLSLLISGICSRSQSIKDTLSLPEFEIRSNFLLDNNGFKRTRLDSGIFLPALGADLSAILSERSTIFIKSYGNGTLATPSFRGTSAQHTQVEWNGISLNSPMLGQTDFSTIPVAHFDGLEILYGAAGVARTSGAFGGVVDLVTAPDWNNRIKAMAGQTVASFGNYRSLVSVATGGNAFQSHTKFNFTSAVNDFPYTADDGRRVRQRNASFTESGLSQELFWKLKDRHLFTARVWYSLDDRNLPPTTQSSDTLKTEKLKDKALRAILDYRLVAKGWNLSVRTAMNDQYMKYDNSLLDLHSVHQSYSWINRIRFSWTAIRNLTVRPGIDFTRDWVESSDYPGNKSRSTEGLFAEVNYLFFKKLRSSLILRQDMVDGKLSPFIPALGLEYRPFARIELAFSANAGKNYRYPTLNELWWKDYGNPDLRPEKNYSFEAGCTYRNTSKNRRFGAEMNLSGYYSRIFDMITWSPVSGSGGIFRPQNVDEIFARGLEVGINLGMSVSGFQVRLKGNYGFCRSTYEKDRSAYDDKIGNQQYYIPIHTLNSSLTLERWKFFLTYDFVFTGDRYTGSDNLSVMPAYKLSNIIFGKNIVFRHFVITLQVDIDNLLDLDYQSVASRPMPGRNFGFTARIGIPGEKKVSR